MTIKKNPLALLSSLVSASVLVCGTTVLVVGTTARATPPIEDFLNSQDLRSISFPIDDPSVGSPITRAIAGDFSGDHIPDVFTLRGDAAYAFAGPTMFRSWMKISTATKDIALLPGQGPQQTDGLVAVHSGGVRFWWYDQAIQEMASRHLGSTMKNSKRILAGHLDTSNKIDLVSLAANGTTIKIQYEALSLPIAGPFSASPPIPAGPVLDLALLNWSGSSAQEIAVVSTEGLEIFSSNGNRLDFFPNWLSKAILVPIRQPGLTHDRLSLLVDPVGSGQDWFLTTLDDANGLEATVFIGTVGMVSACAGDLDLDGKDDLVMRHTTFQDPAVMLNRSDPGDPSVPTFSFDDFGFAELGLGDDPAPNAASWPLVSDFDHDGDGDLVVCIQETESVLLLHNQLIDQNDLIPGLETQNLYYFLAENSTLPELELPLTPPTTLIPGADWIETVVWKKQGPVSPVDLISSQHDFHAVTPTWPDAVTVTIDDPAVVSPASFYVLYRMVNRNGAGKVTDAGPAGLVVIYTNTFQHIAMPAGPPLQLPNGGREPLPCDCPGSTTPPQIPFDEGNGGFPGF